MQVHSSVVRMSRSNSANIYHFKITAVLSQKCHNFEDKSFHWFKENSSEFLTSKDCKKLFGASPSPDLEVDFRASST